MLEDAGEISTGQSSVWCVAFSLDGGTLATAGRATQHGPSPLLIGQASDGYGSFAKIGGSQPCLAWLG